MANDMVKDLLIRLRYEEQGRKQLENAFKRLESFQERQLMQQQKLQVTARKVALSHAVLAKKNQFIAAWADKMGVNTSRLSQIMSNQGLVFDNLGNVVDKAGRKVTNLNSVMAEGKRRTVRFRMEFLSLLFAGMFLQRTLSGLLRTSLDWVGVTEIMSLALGILFLPVAEDLLEWALKFLDWASDLSDTEKKVLGWFIVVGIAVGGLTFLIAQLGLALGGLAAFEFMTTVSNLLGIGTAATGASTKVSALSLALKGLAALALVTIGFTLAFMAVKEEDIRIALAEIFGSALAIGLAALILGASAPAAITIGALAALVTLEIKFQFLEKGADAIMNYLRGLKEKIGRYIKGIDVSGPTIGGNAWEHSATINPSTGLPYGQASGGPVSPNIPYIVGERGPEMFVPSGAGRIIPNNQLGGGIVVNYTINASGGNAREMEELIKRNNIKLVSDLRRIIKT